MFLRHFAHTAEHTSTDAVLEHTAEKVYMTRMLLPSCYSQVQLAGTLQWLMNSNQANPCCIVLPCHVIAVHVQ